MAIVTASTRSEFFRRYNGFELRPQASLYAEFVRLAKARQWKRGSNSKVYEKSWRLCFGDAVPVGRDIGYVDTEDDELIAKLQDLNISRGSKKKLKHKEVAPEFTAFYGSASNDLQVWQQMCRDCGIKDVPGKLSQCKAALKSLAINIFHFIEAKSENRLPHRFRSKKLLVEYMESHPERVYPLKLAKQNKLLTALLVQCW